MAEEPDAPILPPPDAPVTACVWRAPSAPFEVAVESRTTWQLRPFVNTGLSTPDLGAVGGVGLLSDGLLVAFHRAGVTPNWKEPGKTSVIDEEPIVLIKTETGEIVRRIGLRGGFKVPHGVFVDTDDSIWVTDVGLHQVFKFSREGRLLMTLGAEGGPLPGRESQESSDNSDPTRFNKPADVAVDPSSGTVYVADGYGNSRVLAFDPSGRFLRRFGGEFGSGPGQINNAHSLAYAEGRLILCDRNNSRLHVYDAESSKLLETWNHESELIPPDPKGGPKYWSEPGTGRLAGHRLGFTWAVRWDATSRLLYTLEGSMAVMRALSGEVVGKWNIEPAHDLAVSTRAGRTRLFIGDLRPTHGRIFCFCGMSRVKRARAD